jgi:hypothetical protein
MPISGGTLYHELFKFDHSNLTLLRINRWGPDRAAPRGESGLWQKHEVALVQFKPAPEIYAVKHSMEAS